MKHIGASLCVFWPLVTGGLEAPPKLLGEGAVQGPGGALQSPGDVRRRTQHLIKGQGLLFDSVMTVREGDTKQTSHQRRKE